MKLINTGDPQIKPSTIMLLYGHGGVGKTTFGATAPKPLLLDCENGSKYFGMRGINIPAAIITDWSDMADKELIDTIKSDAYETIVVDPIGELMDKLIDALKATGNRKLTQSDGSLSMAGWGEAKERMRRFVKGLRDTGKNVILIAHVDEKGDEDRLVKRPMIATKISEELINLVDIVGYMTSVQSDGESKRVILVDPASDKYIAKDRTGQLGAVIEPDFSKIVYACQGTKTYAWSKPNDTKKEDSTKDESENIQTETPKPQPEKKPLSNPHLQAAREKMEKAEVKDIEDVSRETEPDPSEVAKDAIVDEKTVGDNIDQ